MVLDPGQSMAGMTERVNDRLAAAHTHGMALIARRHHGADRVRLVGNPRAAAVVAFVSVRVLLLHRLERRQSGAADGSCDYGRCMGLLRACAIAGRRARAAADVAGGDPDSGLHARAVSVDGAATAQCAIACAELVSLRWLLRDPHDRVFRAVAGLASRLSTLA